MTESILWQALSPEVTVPPVTVLPDRVDAAVIGGGYTGLAAARALALGGASVVVLERDRVGSGASGRNGGMVLPGYKVELPDLVRRHGLPLARRLWDDSLAAIGFVESLVTTEGIACDWRRSGHVTLAAKPSHLGPLEGTRELLHRDFGYHTELLGPTELRGELGSPRYFGGLLDPGAGALQPAAYLAGLAASASRAGAGISELTGVRAINREPGGFRLETERGFLKAGEVVVATNGYTGRLTQYLARRIVPVGSFIVATAPLEEAVARRLIPNDRMLSDTRNLLYYFRLSPDRRLVFGGRAAFVPTAVEESRTLLAQGIAEVFPDLGPVPLEHAWGGTVGFTFSQMPHAGRHEGITYAAGYGGHGVAMASWLGDRIGHALGGRGPWPALTELRFPAVPFYSGRPWFLPLAGAYYALKDRLV